MPECTHSYISFKCLKVLFLKRDLFVISLISIEKKPQGIIQLELT